MFLFLFEAFSSFPLYLLGYGLRFAPPATQKDAAAIRARVVVVILNVWKKHKVCHPGRIQA
ncbi:hypothetical protein A0O34_13010 [Chryseobacterium glaciei]|uniref:Uncharacterized protein n=1 Tax=Chryseobacterium glaciei TaxID=1685010 RepID=A0A172XWQ8_9FLAO|nr:hypothetical protein A0O34_13010 [Chryseobacterium glaciei]